MRRLPVSVYARVVTAVGTRRVMLAGSRGHSLVLMKYLIDVGFLLPWTDGLGAGQEIYIDLRVSHSLLSGLREKSVKGFRLMFGGSTCCYYSVTTVL